MRANSSLVCVCVCQLARLNVCFLDCARVCMCMALVATACMSVCVCVWWLRPVKRVYSFIYVHLFAKLVLCVRAYHQGIRSSSSSSNRRKKNRFDMEMVGFLNPKCECVCAWRSSISM